MALKATDGIIISAEFVERTHNGRGGGGDTGEVACERMEWHRSARWNERRGRKGDNNWRTRLISFY